MYLKILCCCLCFFQVKRVFLYTIKLWTNKTLCVHLHNHLTSPPSIHSHRVLMTVIIFAKTLYLDVWLGPEYTSGNHYTEQKMKFSIKNFFSKCDQIRSSLQIWSHLLKKFLIANFIFCAVLLSQIDFKLILNCFEQNQPP